MSQMGKFISLASLNALGTLTGNVGGAVSGDIAANIDFTGTDPITVTGTPASNELVITVADATEAQKGVAELSTDAEAIAGTSTDTLIVPSSLLAKLGAQTANTIPYGAGTAAALSWTAAGTDGQLVIAATGLAPAFGSLTSSSGFIKFSTGVNTLDLDVGAAVAVSFAGDSGTATPAIGVLTLTGGNNITTSAVGSIVTFNVTGATEFAVQVGSTSGSLADVAVGATNTVLLGNTAAAPTWGQVDLTADVTGTLPVSEGGTGAVSLTDGGIVLGSGTGAVTVLGQASDGQLPIGSGSADPVLTTLTEGSNITITNGAGTITIAASGGGGSTSFEPLSSDPASPTNAQTWFNTASSVFKGSYFPDGTWTAKADLNTGRRTLAGAGTGADALSFGGFTSGVVATTERYDGGGNSWTAKANMNTARGDLAGAGTAEDALSFGGWSVLKTT